MGSDLQIALTFAQATSLQELVQLACTHAIILQQTANPFCFVEVGECCTCTIQTRTAMYTTQRESHVLIDFVVVSMYMYSLLRVLEADRTVSLAESGCGCIDADGMVLAVVCARSANFVVP